MHTPLRKSLVCLLSLALGTGIVPRLAAQVTSATNDAEKSAADSLEEATLILSPFVVTSEKDSGYVATNTLAGSRLNTQLKNTPVAISVLTKEFITDIGAVNIKQAMEYATGGGNDIGGGGAQAGAVTGNGLIGNDFNFSIRGYRAVQQTRDFFPISVAADSFNIERVDIARGPNSILFGVGGAGGLVNYTPKRANLGQNKAELLLRTASWNEKRVGLDINHTLIDQKLAVRLNAIEQEADGYRDFESDDQRRGALAFTWQATNSTTVRVSGEAGTMHQNRVRPWMPFDNVTEWRNLYGEFAGGIPFGTARVPATNDQFYSEGNPFWTGPYPGGLAFEFRTAGNAAGNSAYFTNGVLGGKMLSLGARFLGTNFFRTSFALGQLGFNNNLTIKDESLFPRTGNITGPGAYVDTDYHTYGVTIEQRVGRNLFIELTANTSGVKTDNRQPIVFSQIGLWQDVNSTMPTFNADRSYDAIANPTQGTGALIFPRAVANPNVGKLLAAYTPIYSLGESDRDDLRLSASYKLDLGRLGRHDLLVFGIHSEVRSENEAFFETNVAPNRPNPNTYNNGDNFNRRITYIDPFSSVLAERGVPDPWKNPIPSGPMYSRPGAGFVDGWVRNSWGRGKNVNTAVAFASHSTFFNESLATTIGGRRDNVKIWGDAPRISPLGEALEPTPAASYNLNQSKNTYTAGAVYHLPVVTWLSVFGNKSTNFKNQGGAKLFDDITAVKEIGPLTGTGEDYGVKLDLFDGRINATLARFKVVQANAATGFNGAYANYIRTIWTTILNNGPTGSLSDTVHQPSGAGTVGQTSDGYEFEVTANPTKNWRILFNVSKSENFTSGVGGGVSDYIAKNRAEWNAKSSLAVDTTRFGFLGNNTIGAYLTGLDALLAFDRGSEGLMEVNHRPWNANAFTAYSFDEGLFKGFTIGGGVNYRGESVRGINTVTREMFMGKSYYLVNGMLAYERKLSEKVGLRLQLNIQNLMNNKDLQTLASNYNPATDSFGEYDYYFEPRNYSLSATFSF